MSAPHHASGDTPAERRDRVCSEFARDLKDGKRPSIEEYIERVPEEDRPELLEELIREEHSFRFWQAGELPLLSEYTERFPEHFDVVERAFFTPPSNEGAKDGVLYGFIRKLGQGGQAAVYLAKDTRHGEDVAVKVFDGRAPTTHFHNEKYLLRKASHQHVVPILDSFQHAGRLFIVLKYIDGPTLAQKLEKDGPFRPDEAARILQKAAEAIAYVHRKTGKAVVHSDLKPANIILDCDGDPYILDFGLASLTEKLIEGTAGAGGTVEYMSPEQVTAYRWKYGSVDTRSDIWALGAVLYELLTGRPPFGRRPNRGLASPEQDREALGRFLDAIEGPRGTVPFTVPRDLNPRIPRDLETIVVRCLKRDPDERFQDAGDLAKGLHQWLETATLLPPAETFRSYLEEKHRHFSERPWLLHEVLTWHVCGNERTLLITGGFGTGKTAFLADLVHRNPDRRILAYHCCQFDTPETCRPSFFVRNLAAMLRDRLPGYEAALANPGVANVLDKARCDEDPASVLVQRELESRALWVSGLKGMGLRVPHLCVLFFG